MSFWKSIFSVSRKSNQSATAGTANPVSPLNDHQIAVSGQVAKRPEPSSGNSRTLRMSGGEIKFRSPNEVARRLGEINAKLERELFTNTETKRDATLPAIGQSAESPKGLGRDGHKPLMQNREAHERPSPIGNAAGNILQGRAVVARLAHNQEVGGAIPSSATNVPRAAASALVASPRRAGRSLLKAGKLLKRSVDRIAAWLTLSVTCSWCNRPLHAAWLHERTSHSICPACEMKFEQQI